MAIAPYILFIIFALVFWNLVSKALRGKILNGFFAASHGGAVWAAAARKLNLNYVVPTREIPQPALTGKVNGLNVEVFQMDSEPGASTFCIVQFKKPLIPGFYLSNFKDADEWNAASPLEHVFPGCFSSSVRARANDQLMILTFLDRRRINILKNAFGSSMIVEIKEEYFMLAEPGLVTPERLTGFIQRAADFAAAFASENGAPLPFEKDFIAQKAQVQINPEDTAPVYDFAHRGTPAEKKESVPEPVPEPIPEPVPDPMPEAVPEEKKDDLSALNVTMKLFGVPFPGAAERAYFDSVTGKNVCWQGTLRSAYPYGTDFVFGKGPGCKATFVLPDITGKNGLRVSVKATVMLPAAAADELKGRNGETFTFTGTLMKYEPFAREIFIRDGVLKS